MRIGRAVAVRRHSHQLHEDGAAGAIVSRAVIDFVALQITIKGLTGEIKFDENGFRTDFKLRLQELTREGLKVVGEWTPANQVKFMSNYTKAMAEGYRQTLRNKTLVITTAIASPYTMMADNWEENGLTGNDRFEGALLRNSAYPDCCCLCHSQATAST